MALETCAVAGAQAAIEVSLRALRGKQIGTDTYPATLVRLGVRFAGLDWDVRTRLQAFSRARVSGA